MSRIGKHPVTLPAGVVAEVSGQDVQVKGPKGNLSVRVHDDISVSMENGQIVVLPRSETRQARALWATMRTLVNNLVVGVSQGYTKNLVIQGVGYRANVQGTELVLQLGYSHDIKYPIPQGISIAVEKQTQVAITGIDKQKVGQVAAEIIAFRPPEPYKGKGVRHEGQYILRKEGKKK
jgi:large subunit ribosomal protein L6